MIQTKHFELSFCENDAAYILSGGNTKMIRYEFRTLEQDTISQLIDLSRLWMEENCSYGMVVNEKDDLKEPLAVALDGDKIIGYCFGDYYTQERNTSYIPLDSRCFSLEELYILPQYRGQGIGKALFRMMEQKVSKECAFVTLTTSTKNYKTILHLYVEELGMDFHSAFLIKKTGESQ